MLLQPGRTSIPVNDADPTVNQHWLDALCLSSYSDIDITVILELIHFKSLRYPSLNIFCGRVFQLFSCYISQTVVTFYLKI